MIIMAEVSWIKVQTDLFENPKIRHIRREDNGNDIVLIWILLLTIAGKCNADGVVSLTQSIPYTPEMIAEDFKFKTKTVRDSLKKFEELGMIFFENGFIFISNWEKYQNIEGMEKIREQGRIRVSRFRERKKVHDCNATCNATVTQCNATEEDKEKKRTEGDKEGNITCQQIVDLFNSICHSFPVIRSLSEARKKSIKARLNTYSIDDFKTLFEKAEASSFLKGKNNRNWTANFDWLLKDANMAKVLDGNYDDKSVPSASGTGSKAKELDDFYSMATSWAEGGE